MLSYDHTFLLSLMFYILLDSGDSGRIDYDEKAIMSLLDRTSSHDDAPDEDKDIMANEYLASFKVKGGQFQNKISQKFATYSNISVCNSITSFFSLACQKRTNKIAALSCCSLVRTSLAASSGCTDTYLSTHHRSDMQ